MTRGTIAGRPWRKATVLAVVATGLAIALVVLFVLSRHTPDRIETAAQPPVNDEPPDSYTSAPRGDGRASHSVTRRGPNPLWSAVDEGSVEAVPPYGETWSKAGRVLVDVTAAVSRANVWRVGDRLAVELPQLGGIHEWTVERIDEGQDARSRSVRGWIEIGDERLRRIVVTVGPGRILAYIDTPRGPYELTGNARLAWLLPSSSMMAGMDFSKPDYLLPERARRDGGPG